jgi:hypothetical protein
VLPDDLPKISEGVEMERKILILQQFKIQSYQQSEHGDLNQDPRSYTDVSKRKRKSHTVTSDRADVAKAQ